MDFSRDRPPSGPLVGGFAGRGFRVGDAVYAGGLLLTPERAIDWEAPPSVEALAIDHIAEVLSLAPLPEFLLLGTGPRLAQPPRAFVAALKVNGFGVEAMDSRAAARAWGVLRQEGRWIAAAMMPL